VNRHISPTLPIVEIVLAAVAVAVVIYVFARWRGSAQDHDALHQLPDAKLRETTLEFTPHIRQFEAERRTEEEIVIREYLETKQNPPPKYNEDRAFTARKLKVQQLSDGTKAAWQQRYLKKAVALRHELERRIGKKRASQLHDERYRLVAFDGEVTGNAPIAAAAGYLESLAHELPDD
jgi:hypothetical protein